MKRIVYFVALTVAVAIACNKVDEINTDQPEAVHQTVTFRASIADTRTTLVDGKKTYWAEGDALSVYGTAEHGYYFAADAAGATATFSATEDVESGLVASEPYALYPYHYESTLSGSVISTYIDNKQTPVAGDFGSQKPLLVAKGDSEGNLAFSQVCAVIKFTITDENITSVTFKGNKDEFIAGTVKVDAAAKTCVVDTDADWNESSIYLANADASTLAAGTYYFVIAPTVFDGGITLSWTPSVDGKDNWKSTTQTVTTQAGHILNLGTIGYTDADAGAPTVEQVSETSVTLEGESVNYTVQFKVTDDKALKSITLKGWKDFDDYAHLIEGEGGYTLDENTLQGAAEYMISYDLTFSEAGTYKFWVTAYDRAGNVYDAEAGYITVSKSDNQAPEAEITSGETATVGEVHTFTVELSDDVSLGWCDVYVYDSNWAALETTYPNEMNGLTNYTLSKTYTFTAAGTYYFGVNVHDNASHTTWVQQEITVIDASATYLTIAELPWTLNLTLSEGLASHTFYVEGESEKAIDGVYFELYDTEWNKLVPYGCTNTWDWCDWSMWGKTGYQIEKTVTFDTAGVYWLCVYQKYQDGTYDDSHNIEVTVTGTSGDI